MRAINSLLQREVQHFSYNQGNPGYVGRIQLPSSIESRCAGQRLDTKKRKWIDKVASSLYQDFGPIFLLFLCFSLPSWTSAPIHEPIWVCLLHPTMALVVSFFLKDLYGSNFLVQQLLPNPTFSSLATIIKDPEVKNLCSPKDVFGVKSFICTKGNHFKPWYCVI